MIIKVKTNLDSVKLNEPAQLKMVKGKLLASDGTRPNFKQFSDCKEISIINTSALRELIKEAELYRNWVV